MPLTHPTNPHVLQAYVLPDIVYLPTLAIVYALNEPVPAIKPRFVVSAATVAQARSPHQPTPQHRQSTANSRSTHRRSSRDDGSTHVASTPPAAAAAARLSVTPVQMAGGQGRPLAVEWVGSSPASQQQHAVQHQPDVGRVPAAPPTASLLGPGHFPATPQPHVPVPLAQAAAQVQAMLQQQLSSAGQARMLLPMLQPMSLGMMLPSLQPSLQQVSVGDQERLQATLAQHSPDQASPAQSQPAEHSPG